MFSKKLSEQPSFVTALFCIQLCKHASECCLTAVPCTHRAAVRALVAVVDGAREAGLAEGVSARRRDRLVQQLHAQDALQIIRIAIHRTCPTPKQGQLLGPADSCIARQLYAWMLITQRNVRQRREAYFLVGAATGEVGDAGSGPMAASTAAMVARMPACPGSRLKPSSSAVWASLYCSNST